MSDEAANEFYLNYLFLNDVDNPNTRESINLILLKVAAYDNVIKKIVISADYEYLLVR